MLNMYPNRLLSYSSLKEFAKSPAHYLHYCAQKEEERFLSTTEAQIKGKLFECLLTHESKFDDLFILEELPNPEKAHNTKENQEYLKTLKEIAFSSRKHIVSKTLSFDVQDAVNKAKKHSFLKYIFNIEHHDYTISPSKEYVHEETNLKLIAKPDLIFYEASVPVIVDFKTTKNAHPTAFQKDIFFYEYYLQLALYCEAYQTDYAYLVAFELEAPFGISVHLMDMEVISYGRKKLAGLLRDFRMCYEEGDFDKGYDYKSFSDNFLVTLPSYLKKETTVINNS